MFYKRKFSAQLFYGKPVFFLIAVADCTKAIELNPGYAESYCNRGISYYNLNEFEFAIKDYTKAIELNPASSKSYMARGITEMDNYHNLPAAITDFDNALLINPSFAKAYYTEGWRTCECTTGKKPAKIFKW